MNCHSGKRNIVLHITPHLGGGVGSVVLNYLEEVKGNPDFLHKIICLEYANEKALSASRTTGFRLMESMSAHPDTILEEISKADILLIHWWNHPLLYDFLVRQVLPPCRALLWSHISGFHPPYVFTRAILDYPDIVVLTSPASLDVPEIRRCHEEEGKALRVVWSTGGIADFESLRPRPHRAFTVGYIGTVDYSKMHPDFLKMSALVSAPDARFIVCGGPSEKTIREEAIRFGWDHKFRFKGQVNDTVPYLAEFDVFGYPLSPYHYGTCEQSLCEAMAAGIPPVVLSNNAERFIVRDHVDGLVAENQQQYAESIELLHNRPQLRLELSENARKTAKARFTMEVMVQKWEKIFEEILPLPKTSKQWRGNFKGRTVPASRVFLESLGKYGRPFSMFLDASNTYERGHAMEQIVRRYNSSAIWEAQTRGTPNHYNTFFPGDEYLRVWSRLSKKSHAPQILESRT